MALTARTVFAALAAFLLVSVARAGTDCGGSKITVKYSESGSFRCADYGLGGSDPRCVSSGDSSSWRKFPRVKLYCDTWAGGPSVLCVAFDGSCPCVRNGNAGEKCDAGCPCAGGLACVSGTCLACAPKTCSADYPGRCGALDNGCGGTLNCTCASGTCSAGTCSTLKTCADYPGQCGTFPDGGGDNITCGCAGPQTCVSGACYPPYDAILKVRCPGGATQTIAGSTVPMSDVHVRKSGITYDALLVPAGSPDSSCVNVRVSTTTLRLMKM